MSRSIRTKIATISNYLEIALSVVVLVGITVMSIQLVKDILGIIRSIDDASMSIPFETFMGDALQFIIGIEFVKMLVRNTPKSVVEVLLFAMARKLIIGGFGTVDVAVGIGAIAILFVIRRFLFYENEGLWDEFEGPLFGPPMNNKTANRPRFRSVSMPEKRKTRVQ
ncbi:MAG TPA: transporter [Firmicutes bacterium]|nr:transporter [Bacillota bacterium]